MDGGVGGSAGGGGDQRAGGAPAQRGPAVGGTESGLFVTVNGGRHWVLVHGTLPRVPIDDVIINARENDVILGTHGRSIIVLDDMALLES